MDRQEIDQALQPLQRGGAVGHRQSRDGPVSDARRLGHLPTRQVPCRDSAERMSAYPAGRHRAQLAWNQRLRSVHSFSLR